MALLVQHYEYQRWSIIKKILLECSRNVKIFMKTCENEHSMVDELFPLLSTQKMMKHFTFFSYNNSLGGWQWWMWISSSYSMDYMNRIITNNKQCWNNTSIHIRIIYPCHSNHSYRNVIIYGDESMDQRCVWVFYLDWQVQYITSIVDRLIVCKFQKQYLASSSISKNEKYSNWNFIILINKELYIPQVIRKWIMVWNK